MFCFNLWRALGWCLCIKDVDIASGHPHRSWNGALCSDLLALQVGVGILNGER